MNKKVLLSLGVLVVALVVVLVFMSRSGPGDEPAASARTQPAERQAAPPAEPSTARPAPQLPPEVQERVDTALGNGREYVRDDGARVRDHRGGTTHPIMDTATPNPVGVRKMDRESIMAVRGALRPIMRECGSLEGLDIGEQGKLQGVVTVSVKSGVLSVDGFEGQTAEIGNPQQLIDCVSGKARALKLKVPGEDIEAFPLTMPFRMHQKTAR